MARGKMMVIAPDSKSELRPVLLVYDQTNDMYGIQLLGESPLKGYSFFVRAGDFAETAVGGAAKERLTIA